MPIKLVFDVRAIVPIVIMFIVTAVETIGDLSGITEGGLGREATDKELSGGVACDGIGSTFATIVVSGIQLITKDGVGNREVTIVAISLGLGYGLGSTANALSKLPEFVGYIFGGSGIVPAALVAIILNIVLKKDKVK